jgi:hypothetical protein
MANLRCFVCFVCSAFALTQTQESGLNNSSGPICFYVVHLQLQMSQTTETGTEQVTINMFNFHWHEHGHLLCCLVFVSF